MNGALAVLWLESIIMHGALFGMKSDLSSIQDAVAPME